MKINADLSQRVVVASHELEWVASPAPGVQRRMLERNGGEIARLTSLVRYAPRSRFEPHTHGGGEEFLVLEGTFCDEHGEYTSGYYVRNPVGSRHAPYTREGCIILVKLWWMHETDRDSIRLDTRRESLWCSGPQPGQEVMDLHRCANEVDELWRLAPCATLPERELDGGEEIFVLAGWCRDDGERYGEGIWLRQPIGHAPALQSPKGCRLYRKHGHLRNPPPMPA